MTVTTGSVKVVDAGVSEVTVSVSSLVAGGGLVDVIVVRSACKVIVTVSVEAGRSIVVLTVGPGIVCCHIFSYFLAAVPLFQYQAGHLP